MNVNLFIFKEYFEIWETECENNVVLLCTRLHCQRAIKKLKNDLERKWR